MKIHYVSYRIFIPKVLASFRHYKHGHYTKTNVSLEMVAEHTTVSVGAVEHIAVQITVSLGWWWTTSQCPWSRGGVVEHIAVSLGWRSTSQCPGWWRHTSLGVVVQHITVCLGLGGCGAHRSVLVWWWSTSQCPGWWRRTSQCPWGWRGTSQCPHGHSLVLKSEGEETGSWSGKIS